MSRFESNYLVTATSLTLLVGFYMVLLALAFWCYTLSKRRRNNAKSFLSLTVALASWALPGLAAVVAARYHAPPPLLGLFGLMIVMGALAAATLAVIGLMECARERKIKGRLPAILTLSFSLLVFCVFCSAAWSGVKRSRSGHPAAASNY